MKYHEIYQKVMNVLESCFTSAQLKTGKRYCYLLLDRYQDDNNTFNDIEWIIEHYGTISNIMDFRRRVNE